MVTNPPSQKVQLRREAMRRRADAHLRLEGRAGELVQSRGLSLLDGIPGQIVSGYLPIRDEIDTLALFRRLNELAPKPVVGVVSSIGADKPSNFYLRTKQEMEDGLRSLQLPHVIVRPSFLLGDRAEFRLGERLGIALFGKPLGWLSRLFPNSQGLRRYAPIQAEQVAKALVGACLDATPPPAGHILEGLSLHGRME